MNDFQNEWVIIHSDIERYERYSLVIKLFSVLITVLSVALAVNEGFAVVLLLVLWLQDGIWTTFQKRLEERIRFIEQKLKIVVDKNDAAFQLYSQWQDKQQSSTRVIKEYLLNALKPTVVFPHVLLILLMLIAYQYIE